MISPSTGIGEMQVQLLQLRIKVDVVHAGHFPLLELLRDNSSSNTDISRVLLNNN